MNIYYETKEWAKSIGNDAWWLRKFGATNQQIKNYVDFKAASVKQQAEMTGDNVLLNYYYKIARSNFKENTKTTIAKEGLKETIDKNFYCLNWR